MFRKIFLVFTVFSLVIFSNVFAATKEDVIAAINKTYTVVDETYRLPQNVINKGVNYLNTHPLTSAQYDNILKCIDNAVALAREVGTTDISKVSREDLQKALKILTEASNSANVDLNEYINENNIPIPGDKEKPKENATNNTPGGNKENIDKNKVDGNTQISDSSESTNGSESADNNSGNILHAGASGDKQSLSGESNATSEEDVQDFKEKNNSDNIIDRNIKFFIIGLILILLVLFLIFYLILKSKWNKIIRYVLMVLFVLLIIITLVILVGTIIYLEEIRSIYKLYYMFK